MPPPPASWQYLRFFSLNGYVKEPAVQNLLQRVVRFFHWRSSCTTTHISADVQRITLNALCTMISDGRTKQLNTFCCITGFMRDFLFHSCGTYSVLSRSHSFVWRVGEPLFRRVVHSASPALEYLRLRCTSAGCIGHYYCHRWDEKINVKNLPV